MRVDLCGERHVECHPRHPVDTREALRLGVPVADPLEYKTSRCPRYLTLPRSEIAYPVQQVSFMHDPREPHFALSSHLRYIKGSLEASTGHGRSGLDPPTPPWGPVPRLVAPPRLLHLPR